MEPLDMNRLSDRGELYVKGCAFAGSRADVDLAGVFLDNAVADGEAEPSAAAAGFRGEEGIEDAVNMFARDARTGIDDFNLDAAIVGARAHFQQAAAGHGVASIQEKIE